MDKAVYHSMAINQNENWWYSGRRKLLVAILERYRISGHVLDIGAGTGAGYAFLSRLGETISMEASREAIDYFQQVYPKAAIFQGSLPDKIDPEIKKSRYDLITLLDVLEHIDDDRSSINEIKQLLADNGWLLITVPAYSWLWSSHDKVLMHQRRYRAEQMRKLVTDSGLTVEYLGYFNAILFPLAVISRLTLRFKKSYDPVSRGIPAINTILTRIFSLEAYLVKFMQLPYGLSVIVLAKNGSTED